MLDQHSQQELRFWGSVWPLQNWESCLKVFPNSEGARAPGSPSLQPPGCLCQHGAQHHHPGLGVGGPSAVPTRAQRDVFTQEGLWRCEKGQSSHYLCPELCKGLRQASPGSYQLQTFICLRAARPPSGGLLPTPALLLPPPQPGPQVSPSLLLLAARPGGVGSVQLPRATLSQHGNNSGTRSCVCAAPGRCIQARGGGGLGRLVFHLAGSLGKA